MDLNRFRFDYDLTFAVLMMDAEGGVYSRYGTADGERTMQRMSLTGLKRAMQAVLDRHARGPKPPAAPEAKPVTLTDLPLFVQSPMAKSECYHCHFAADTEVRQLRLEGRFRKEMLYRYPHPENLGLTLEVDENNRVRAVAPGSPAEAAGIRTGDEILRAGETPVLTEADLQWALDPVPDPGAVTLQIRRGAEKPVVKSLTLPRGWRKTDISWRPSQGSIPPIIGIWEEKLDEAERRRLGIPPGRLALRISFLFPGEKWVRTRGDLRLGDVIVGFNGEALPEMNARQLHSYVRMNFEVGRTIGVDVIRDGRRIRIPVPCTDVAEE